MIFFGSKGKQVPGQLVEGIQCTNCENNKFVSFGIMKYFHVYWIPAFMTSKQVGIECTQCKTTHIGEEVPDELVKQLKPTLFTKGRTLPMFSGLILAALLIVGMVPLVKNAIELEKSYISQPVVHDIYSVDFRKIFPDSEDDEGYKYGVMRIVDIDGSQVSLQISEYSYNRRKGIRKAIRKGKADKDDFYSSHIEVVTLAEINDWYKQGAIFDVER